MPTDVAELKPCPFCGGTRLDIPQGEFGMVSCALCWAIGPLPGYGSWNDRATPAAQPAPEIAKPLLDENTELPLEETINCLRCDGEGVEYHRKTKEQSRCSLCKGELKVDVPTYLGQQILDFVNKHQGRS